MSNEVAKAAVRDVYADLSKWEFPCSCCGILPRSNCAAHGEPSFRAAYLINLCIEEGIKHATGQYMGLNVVPEIQEIIERFQRPSNPARDT